MFVLSITPDYLVRIGLLDEKQVPSADKDIGLLLRQAMDKVAFLPFGLLVDKWRWGVFSGEITPDNYNKAWTDLRHQYQGIIPPVPRSAADFDPGAKFHIPGTTPYTIGRASCRDRVCQYVYISVVDIPLKTKTH